MKKQHIVILGVLLAALAALLFVLLPITANLVIAYVFWLIGIAFLLVSVFALGAKDKSLLMELPLFLKARSYLVLTAVISGIVLLLENLGVFTLPFALHLVAQVAAVLVIGIQVTQLNLGKSHIEAVGAKVAEARGALVNLVTDVNALKNRVEELPEDAQPKVRKAIADVSDALRYSDPISTPAVRELDGRIASGVAALGRAVSAKQADEALNLAKTLLADIKERNERNKNAKA
ncbi:MAG: hypothetical protein GXZ04_00975 [Clostridiales bacterium]|nr:hypothetical protein [Clostridiales bacterium]